MVDPGVLDITNNQGSTFTLNLKYKDSAGNGVNMTGFSVAAKIVDRTSTTTLATFAHLMDQATGKFQLKLTSATTTEIAQEGPYDVLVTEPSGDKFFLFKEEQNGSRHYGLCDLAKSAKFLAWFRLRKLGCVEVSRPTLML